MSSDERKGLVYLVGSGPGDPDLVTVKAKHLLEQCDVVVYDALIPYELVATLPVDVERRYVGKKTERHSLPQQEINELLARLACEGQRVVRLKGGDPFVFGRGGEEAKYLKERGIEYVEVDISRDRAAAQRVREWGGGTEITPIFDVKGTIVVDFDRTKLGQVLGVA